ncbi:MAG TPA: serine/threonine-protein kinase [Gemmatimonadales bacterium]|nr:serine/threonine-protein kinase [Gemmatimonadales bacterium]
MPRDLLPRLRQVFDGLYTVEREIGRGGAARVFLATDPHGCQVALKVLHPELQVSIQAERFLREIKLASTIRHPHIAGVTDWGEREWALYYVMPFIEGVTLRACLDRVRRLPVADTLRVADDLLDALGFAHDQGVVHRDVKPDNLIISPAGVVLVDFGIARAIEAAVTDQVTRSGVSVGTAAYMSPEQARAETRLDLRTDLYATGCVLFECLAGHPPFTNPNEAIVVQEHIDLPAPDVRKFRPETPAPLADGIARALAKEPGDRWASAAAMWAALGGGS